ncbi:hypothetical protein MB27_11770 [Actinoplanes utahensis]|uniref:Uncharacterized protein n=1 Tax=Actinoplanes utahensis TaxID=1869 RepID=A0A0A6UPP1_ACTUT|nr:hypothetical protein MB27_11770 [Actinoplanes utahensis]
MLAAPPDVPVEDPAGTVAPAVAATVWARHRSAAGDGLLVVADLGAAGCRVTTCRMEDGLIGVVAEHSAADETGFGAVFDRAVLDGSGADAALLWRTRAAADPRRIRETLELAAARPRYAGAPLFGAGPFPVAGTVAAWEPLGARARDLIHRVAAGLAGEGVAGGGPAWLLLVGGLADFPPAGPDLAAAAPGLALLDVPGDGAPGAGPFAAAHGAALIAAGRATAGDRLAHPVTVRARQITGGRLVTTDIPVPGPIVAGDDPRYAGTGPSGISLDGLPPGAPVLDMRADGTCWSLADPARLPDPGSACRVGVRLAAGRPELVLAPLDGRPPTIHPLTRHHAR